MHVLRPASLVLLTCSLAAPARAQQVYTSEALFLADAGPLGTESFECFPAGPVASSAPIATPAFVMTIQPALGSTQAPMNVQAAPNPDGPHATDGARFVQAGATPVTNGQFDLTFTFASPVTEFAFTHTDFGEFASNSGALTATVLGVTYTLASNPPAQPNAVERFWGIRTPGTPFTTVVVRKTTQGDGMGFDEVLHSDLGVPDHCASLWTELGLGKTGVAGVPVLTGAGGLFASSSNQLALTSAKASSTATLVFGLAQIDAPFKGGTLVPHPLLLVPLPTSGAGTASLPFTFPAGVPAGVPLYFQFWIADPAGTQGFTASNGLRGVTQ
jgi:hypothetical protein